MNLSFYTATTGAAQQQERLNVHGNNIANVNTNGFKARIPAFSNLMTGPVRGITEDLSRGVGSKLESAQSNFEQSALNDTGRALDYAISGNGFFALLDPTTGEFSYTRDGSFTKSEMRLNARDETGAVMLDENGEPVERSAWYLSDGLGRLVIGRNGSPIEITGDESEELPVGIFDFINYDGMQSVGENRFVPVDKNGGLRAGDGKLVQGVLELSGTDLANEMAKVIESQRSFSYMLKMMQASDEIESTTNNLR